MRGLLFDTNNWLSWVSLKRKLTMRRQELNRRDVAGEIVLEALDEHIAFLDRSTEETRIRIRNHIDNHPDLKHKRDLLVSIPGVGEATIQVVLSEFADIERFDRAKCLASFLGVAPREHQSGQSVRGRTRTPRWVVASYAKPSSCQHW